MNFSDKLKQARISAALLQEQVAGNLNISSRTLRGYENGSILPPLDKLEALAKLYNVPLTYLVTDSEDSDSSMMQWISSLSPAELQALQEFIQQQLQDNQQ